MDGALDFSPGPNYEASKLILEGITHYDGKLMIRGKDVSARDLSIAFKDLQTVSIGIDMAFGNGVNTGITFAPGDDEVVFPSLRRIHELNVPGCGRATSCSFPALQKIDKTFHAMGDTCVRIGSPCNTWKKLSLPSLQYASRIGLRSWPALEEIDLSSLVVVGSGGFDIGMTVGTMSELTTITISPNFLLAREFVKFQRVPKLNCNNGANTGLKNMITKCKAANQADYTWNACTVTGKPPGC